MHSSYFYQSEQEVQHVVSFQYASQGNMLTQPQVDVKEITKKTKEILDQLMTQ